MANQSQQAIARSFPMQIFHIAVPIYCLAKTRRNLRIIQPTEAAKRLIDLNLKALSLNDHPYMQKWSMFL
jgi:hypothetical protein